MPSGSPVSDRKRGVGWVLLNQIIIAPFELGRSSQWRGDENVDQGDLMSLCKKSPKTIFLSKSIHNLYLRKKKARILGYFCNLYKVAQSRRSPNGRHFAQSGHPDVNLNCRRLSQGLFTYKRLVNGIESFLKIELELEVLHSHLAKSGQ
jgi:hypothetical protein